LFSLNGYEAGAHLSEETTNATSSAPKGIVYTTIASAITGFVYILGLLYVAVDVDTVLNGDSNQAIVNVYQIAYTSKDGIPTQAGALAMTSLLIINLFFAGFSSMTVTSRIAFAMARDGALPFSKYIRGVNGKTKTPIPCIFLVFIIDAIFCLIPIGSSTAFIAITSITTIGY
jgi:amino acid transporter